MAWLAALLVGLVLGVMGSGGSILIVPILVYLLGEAPKAAIAESLLIVGGIALVGAVPFIRKGLFHWPSLIFFGLPGMAGTYLGAWLGGLAPDQVQLLTFALVMGLAAYSMLRPPRLKPKTPQGAWRWAKPALEGSLVGALTGFVGVGGGFLIVPALVLLGGLPMHLAVGTSLGIIAMKSAAGLWKYLHLLPELGLSVNWPLSLLFLLAGSLGVLLGGRLNRALPQEALRKGFGGFLVVMGVFILATNL